MNIRNYVKRHWLAFLILAAAFAVAALWVTIATLHPMPPRTVTMATGPEGGAYYEFGKRYRKLLAREGVDLRLRQTSGTMENLALLSDPRSGVSVSFLQGGTTSEKDSPSLESLGTVFYEPLWFFSRIAVRSGDLEVLRGRRISVGPEGSGTRALSLELLARNRIDRRFAELLALAPQEAAEKLLRGEIDAAFMVFSWDAPLLRRLLVARDLKLASFSRADAYVALYPFLSKVVVPEGSANIAQDLPPEDVMLLAPKASLTVRSDLHPAIQYLLLDAAAQIHSGPGIFKKTEQFPAAEAIDLPLSGIARQFYRSGSPFLQRHLPFWLAVMIGQLFVLLLPVVGVLYPLFRFLPAVYGWQIRRRIYKLYDELRVIEQGYETRDPGGDRRELDTQLAHLEEKANHLVVTPSYVGMVYMLRDHITLLRGRLGNPEE